MSESKERMLADFICRDLRAGWKALASVDGADVSRGNFMFGRQALVLLEFLCRLRGNGRDQAVQAFARALHERDSRYFMRLPPACVVKSPGEFAVPTVGAGDGVTLLAAIFDLVRNGQAHYYSNIAVPLLDGWKLAVALTGAQYGVELCPVGTVGIRPPDHLALSFPRPCVARLHVRTDVLFMDIEGAMFASGILERGLVLKEFDRAWGIAGEDLVRYLVYHGVGLIEAH